MTIYQFKPISGEPLRQTLPWGFRLKIVPGSKQGDRVQVRDMAGNILGLVSIRSLEVLR